MRKKKIIGILLLIITNLIFIYFICFYTLLSFGLVVAKIGEVQGEVTETKITKEIILFVLFSSLGFLSINFLILKKLRLTKWNLLYSFALIIIGILIFIPFYLSSKKSFIDYQNGTTKLGHFIEKNYIENIKIVDQNETIIIKNKKIFLNKSVDQSVKKDYRNLEKYIKLYWNIMEKKIAFFQTELCLANLKTNISNWKTMS